MIAQTLKTDGMFPPPKFHQSESQLQAEKHEVYAAQENIKNFEPLYTRYYPRIASFLYQRLGDKEMAFEMTAEVFYAAIQNLKKYKDVGLPFSAWLYRIAFNKANDFFRKTKTQRSVNLDTEGIHLLVEEMQPETKVTDVQLSEALQTLDEDELEIIEMRYFEDRQFKEISEITGLNESACKMRIYRALKKLKENFKNI